MSKPRIKKYVEKYWICEGNGFNGVGLNPLEAYRFWVRNTMDDPRSCPHQTGMEILFR